MEKLKGVFNFINFIPLSSDYINLDDGLYYCGFCKTRKQFLYDFWQNGIIQKLPVRCECRKKREDAWSLSNERENIAREMELRGKGLIEKLRGCTFDKDNKKHPDITTQIKHYADKFEWMKENNVWLILSGGVGCGKTFMAACIANKIMCHGNRVNMDNFSRIANSISGYEGKQQYLDALNNCSLLILDDFGMERNTDYMNEIIYSVVDARLISGRPCIITTNLTQAEFVIGMNGTNKRVYDRMAQFSTFIEFDGESQRQEAFAKQINWLDSEK